MVSQILSITFDAFGSGTTRHNTKNGFQLISPSSDNVEDFVHEIKLEETSVDTLSTVRREMLSEGCWLVLPLGCVQPPVFNVLCCSAA